jgi:hypothetical protein
MSWIQDNKFAAMLGGGTLLGAIVLIYVGLSYRGHYAKNLESYLSDWEEVKEFEAIPLYPSLANRAGKTKALNDYRASIGGLQKAFDKFRPKELKNITPQGFTDHAKTAHEEVIKAFEKVDTKLPEAFFLGFETYTAALAREDATGLLDYQLGAVKELMLTLAKAAPSQLQNVYRPKFPEEDGEKWEAGPNDAARALPLELTFKGSERSLREFLTAIGKSTDFFFVVSNLRIMNEKPTTPPRLADAKFEAAPIAPKNAPDPFSGAADFVSPPCAPFAPAPATPPAKSPEPPPATPPSAFLEIPMGAVMAQGPGGIPMAVPPGAPAGARPNVKPAKPAAPPPPAPATKPTAKPARTPGLAPAPAETPDEPVQATPAAPPVPSAPPVDSSRILIRVLGGEELQVFLHIDVLEFLPVKALPEVPK